MNKNIKVGDKVRVKKNRNYFSDSVCVGDIAEIKSIENENCISLKINGLIQNIAAVLFDEYLELIPEPIDFTKAQVFDPPVLLEVSDDPDFPKERTDKKLVFLVYPEFDVPIRTVPDTLDFPVSAYKYAREIKEDAFEEFYKKENPLMKHGTFKEEFRKVWEAGVKHGKENKC